MAVAPGGATIITTPAMVLVWILGLVLMVVTQAWTLGWFQLKFALVLALSGYHGWMVGYGRKLARGERPVSGRACVDEVGVDGAGAAVARIASQVAAAAHTPR